MATEQMTQAASVQGEARVNGDIPAQQGAARAGNTREGGAGQYGASAQADAGDVVHAADLIRRMQERGEPAQLEQCVQVPQSPARSNAVEAQETNADADFAARNMEERKEREADYLLGHGVARAKQRTEGGVAGQDGGGMHRHAVKHPTEETGGAWEKKPVAVRLGRELYQSVQAGDLPQDFSLDTYLQVYPQFLSDCAMFGVKAASRTVQALRGAQAQAQASMNMALRNSSLPRPTRPSFNPLMNGEVDYRKMSAGEFREVKKQIRQQFLQGKQVRL